jgi:hypothetical protein
MAANNLFRSAYKHHCSLSINELRDLAHADYTKLHGYDRRMIRTRKAIAIHVLEHVKKVPLTPSYKVWEVAGINVITNRSC